MNDTQKAMMERYSDLHPLIFCRSQEKARTDGELFDILEDARRTPLPLIWDDAARTWKTTDNMLQAVLRDSH